MPLPQQLAPGNPRPDPVPLRLPTLRLARWPWPVHVTLVWLAGTAFTALFTAVVARHQGPAPWVPAQPDLIAYINGWDAGYYATIHDEGYPETLPRTASGQVDNNPWAFLPLYPLVVRGLTALTGASWEVAAPAVSLAASLGLLLVAHQVFRTRASASTSLWAVAALSFATASPALRFPYAESLGLLQVALAVSQVVWLAAFWHWGGHPGEAAP